MKKKDKIYLLLIAVVAVAILVVIVTSTSSHTEKQNTMNASHPTEPIVLVDMQEIEKIVEVEKLVEVEKVISAGILEDGLKDMGYLVTEEYYFTDVLSFSSSKEFPFTEIKIPLTESSFLVSYEGVVTAGIDFTKIAVEKDDENKNVTIYIPQASIKNVDIDPNSMVLYSEKNGLGNALSVTDFNTSLVSLEKSVQEKAVAKGILDQADQNAERIITNFVGSLIDLSQFHLKVVVK